MRETLANKSRGGRLLRKLKQNTERTTTAILILNTMANTLGAAGSGCADQHCVRLAILRAGLWHHDGCHPHLLRNHTQDHRHPLLAQAVHSGGLCGGRVYIYITYPVLQIALFITHFITASKEADHQPREIAAMTSIGEKEGVFETNESKIINNLIKMRSIKVRSIMTPRTVVLGADENLTLNEFSRTRIFCVTPRIPIYEDSLDHITGSCEIGHTAATRQ